MTSVKVEATIGQEKYFTEVKAGNNLLITDEPLDKGGGNKGFNPFEILATSLASCTAATLKNVHRSQRLGHQRNQSGGNFGEQFTTIKCNFYKKYCFSRYGHFRRSKNQIA